MFTRHILSFLLVLVATIGARGAEIVEVTPLPLTEDSQNVIVTFHADRGNAGLKGYQGTVFAHTGVITNLSSSPSDWKHAPSWGDNNAKYALTRTATDTYELTIGNIRDFYGISSADEKVVKLAFVFRSSDCSREGKTAAGGDIFVELGEKEPLIPSPQADYPTGSHPIMGANDTGAGNVVFCIAAPGKSSVSIVGSWNDMEPTLMNYQDLDGQRYFWTSVADIDPEQTYYYYYKVDGTRVADPYSRLILDPFNDPALYGKPYPTELKGADGFMTIYRGNMDQYDWEVTDFQAPEAKDLVIYEILLRDFTGTEGESNGNGTLKMAEQKLDYLKDLGVNAIELMPVMEFSGNNSWGYNPNFYFALDKAYGTPDEMRSLVDQAHKRGIAVILDVVFNHVDSQHPWVQIYDAGNNPLINATAPHQYSVFNDWRQEHPLVRQQEDDCLKYWMTAYKVDGFRFDLVKGLGNSDSYTSGTEAFNRSRIDNMNRMRQVMLSINPHAIHINEHFATVSEENEMAATGQLGWSNLNNASRQWACGLQKGSNLDGFAADAYGRAWGSAISFAESHDEQRTAYDQLINGGNDKVKRDLPTRITRLGSLAAQMLLSPGPKMIWQFQEMGADENTKQSSGDNNTAPKRVVWNYLNDSQRLALRNVYKELIKIRNHNPQLFGHEASYAASLKEENWGGRSLRLRNGNDELLLLVNPDIKVTNTVSASTEVIDQNNYQVLMQSNTYDAQPQFQGTSVSCELKAGQFIVLATRGLVEIEETLQSPDSSGIKKIFDLQGREMTGKTLSPGIYIKTIGKTSKKIIIK